MKRVLIVNADDCNLTKGVTAAILDCHDHGILTSTTFMINLPVDSATVRAIRARKKLGVGIHLNVTSGRPVSKPPKVKSLLQSNGNFRSDLKNVGAGLPRPGHFNRKGEETSPLQRELFSEYQNQILRFKKIFGRKPTHLDTHHQVHDHPFFLKVLIAVAKQNRLPIRRSKLMLKTSYCHSRESGNPFWVQMDPRLKSATKKADPSAIFGGHSGMTRIQTTEYIFGNLTPEGHWEKEALETLLAHLPEGISEVMCHPGRVDRDLRLISSFTSGRAVEWQLFRSAALKKIISNYGIVLSHYGLCYT